MGKGRNKTVLQKQIEMAERVRRRAETQIKRAERLLRKCDEEVAKLRRVQELVYQKRRHLMIEEGRPTGRPELIFAQQDDRELVRRYVAKWDMTVSRFARELGVQRPQVLRVISDVESVQVAKDAMIRMVNAARMGLPPKTNRQLRRREQIQRLVQTGEVRMHGNHPETDCTRECFADVLPKVGLEGR